MSVISGIGGVVNGASAVRVWTISSTADIQAAVASNTKAGTVLADGNEDWTGNYTAYGATPASMPGEALAFTGTIDGTNGATGTAIVDSVEIVVDIEAGAIIGHTVNFSGNGALTLGAAVATDTTDACMPSSIGCKVELGSMIAVPVWTAIDDVRTVTLTITADNQSYVSSSTSGGVRRTAGNISAAVAITVYTDDFAGLPAVNDENRCRIYVDATTYWLVEFIKFGEASDLAVDREGAAVVGATLNAQFTGFADIAGTCTEGEITDPASATFWPAP